MALTSGVSRARFWAHRGTSEEHMDRIYKATAKRNPGRKAWLVEFRHPLRSDSSNRPGKKTRKGLGTGSEAEARRLVDQLNELLADPSYWSVGARTDAMRRFDERVVEIFFSEIEPRRAPAKALNDLIPLPSPDDGFATVALLGVPGAGKTTVIRQLIGTNPETERFPSTSVNRTTTFPTEVILRPGPFEAAVTFMSEHETRFEVEECLSAAVVEAVDGTPRQIARAFLEKSDMRFRLKYLIGDVEAVDESDPYDDDESEHSATDVSPGPTVLPGERAQFIATLSEYLTRIGSIAATFRSQVEMEQGPLTAMSPDDRIAALDLIEELAVASDEFLQLVSDIVDELRTKFDVVTLGDFERTTTGWPRAWRRTCVATERRDFLGSVTYFSGISYHAWGKLLTPLVTGMRVAGPFTPQWSDQSPRLVLVDTEGLGHKANSTADLPDRLLGLMHQSDVILLVDSAKNALSNFAAGKALEAVVNAGLTRKLAVVFTHMDAVKGDNLRGQAKLDHIFGGLRNVSDNQIAKSVSSDAARFLVEHLEKRTFFVGKIDAFDPTPAKPELNRLLQLLVAAAPPMFAPMAFPRYSTDNLVLAIQEAARDFRQQWQGLLGLAPHAEYKPRPWQTVKALSRRYAEGWDDGFVLRPTSNLVASLSAAVSRFLESPIQWAGNPSAEEKRETIDRVKAAVSLRWPELSQRRLRELPQASWQEAYALRGKGSTFERKLRIEGIYEHWVPIPAARGDQAVFDFLNEVKTVVLGAIAETEAAATGALVETIA